MDSGLRIVRREQSARSRQHRGVLTEAIYEGPSLEILRTEMETASAFDGQEFGDFSSLHFVIGGTPVFRTPHESVDLMPGDSIIFTDQRPYRVLNDAPSRSVILSVLFRAFDKESRA